MHLAWGDAEAAFALRIAERDWDLRPAAVALYRSLVDGEPAEAVLATAPPAARHALAALQELGVLTVNAGGLVRPPAVARTELERSATFRDFAGRLAEARERLAAPFAARAA